MTKSPLAVALLLALGACTSRPAGSPGEASPSATAPAARATAPLEARPAPRAVPVAASVPSAPAMGGAIPFDARDQAPEVAARASGGRPVALYFLATWCGYCRKMEAQTLRTAAVQAEMANWYDVQVDPNTPAGRELARKYTTGAYPTVVVFDARGNLKGTIVGCQDPTTFESRMRAAR